MSHTGAQLFVDALESHGVTHLFGNPGTTELPIMNVIGDSGIEYVLAVHEDVAVGMAAGYAKTRRWHAFESDDPTVTPLGVVNLHVAPGTAHGLGNLFDASAIGTAAPILVTAGAQATDHQHREPNLHGDLVEMTDQFTKWSAEVKDVEALPTMLRRAARTAMSPPAGPVFLSLPFDVTTAETDATPERLGTIPDAGDGGPAAGSAVGAAGGDRGGIDAAADAVAAADEPVLVVGDGLARAGPDAVDAAVRFAEAGGTRVHGEFRSSEIAFPESHPLWAGGLPDDRERSAELMYGDAVVLAGTVSNVPTNPPDVPGPTPADTTSVHVSEDPVEIGKNYPADVGLLGDPGRVLGRLADRVADAVDDGERDRRAEAAAAVRAERLGDVDADDGAGHPELASDAQLADGVLAAAPDARVVAEATTSAGDLRRRGDFAPGEFFNFRGGGLGYGTPAALGTAVAESERDDPRDVIGFVGDGSYMFYPNAMYTAARNDIDVTVVIADNRNYRILKDNTVDLFGGDEDDYDFVGMDFDPPVAFAANAETYGASGHRVEDPDEIADVVGEAVAESGPSLVDVPIHD